MFPLLSKGVTKTNGLAVNDAVAKVRDATSVLSKEISPTSKVAVTIVVVFTDSVKKALRTF